MEFREAFLLMEQGNKIKLPSWCGYWAWEDNSIKMHTKDNRVVDIKDMESVEYTFSNILSDEWVLANEKNTPILGGEATFDFGQALKYLKRGFKIARKGWNGKGIFIMLQVPDEYSKMTHPYIYIDTTGLHTTNPDAPKDRVPWLASQTDMLANDYIFYE